MSRDNLKKVALITGAGSGIGEATAKRFANDGFAVGVLDINGSAAERVATEINQSGGKAVALQADVTKGDQIKAAVSKLRDSFGPVQVLVNNAAVEEFLPFEQITEERFDRVINVNLKSMLFMAQAVVPDMEKAGWGRIVNIAAYGAQLSEPNMSHYYASKGGVISLTRALAAELGRKGITVNSVSPGFIDTPMARRAIEEAKLPFDPSVIYSRYPVPRLGKPEELAAACAFFASEDAGYITAQMLGVNGGAVV